MNSGSCSQISSSCNCPISWLIIFIVTIKVYPKMKIYPLAPKKKKKKKIQKPCFTAVRKKIVDYRIFIVWLVCVVWMEDYLKYINNGDVTYENTSNFTLHSFTVIRKKFIQVIVLIQKIIKLKVQK